MKHPSKWLGPLILLASALTLSSQPASKTSIHVRADHATGPFNPVWNFFGYDEPNYTYAPNGQKLLGEISRMSATPAYIRVHNIFTSGDGSSSLKWGSTNVYTEDAAGNPVYDWKIVDRIFDAFHQARVRPLVELGFMPEALSTHPEPYRHTFPDGPISTGWAYPPKDYKKWADLVSHFAKHLRERYGDADVNTWLWEVWNEPDIDYWRGTPEEFFKLYDYSADALLRAIPGAKIGGPDATGPSERAAKFLDAFLQHCDSGSNFATDKPGAPLAFISFHPKGSPTWRGNHVQMGIAAQLKVIERGFKLVAASSKWRNTPIILGEWDPEGCAACSAAKNPQNGYRNGPLYAAYTAEAFSHTLALAEREHVNVEGIVTWAFEFEDQPLFAGFRELASGGLDKPVLNTFRMFGMLGSERIDASSSAALDTAQVVNDGVRAQPDIRAIATRSAHGIQILVWNYHDDDLAAAPASIDLTISGLSPRAKHALLEHFRIDASHSNAFFAWKAMGSPQPPTVDQYKQLEAAGQLQLLDSPKRIGIAHGTAHLQFELPRQGLSLLRIGW